MEESEGDTSGRADDADVLDAGFVLEDPFESESATDGDFLPVSDFWGDPAATTADLDSDGFCSGAPSDFAPGVVEPDVAVEALFAKAACDGDAALSGFDTSKTSA